MIRQLDKETLTEIGKELVSSFLRERGNIEKVEIHMAEMLERRVDAVKVKVLGTNDKHLVLAINFIEGDFVKTVEVELRNPRNEYPT